MADSKSVDSTPADPTASKSSSPKRRGELILILICLGVIATVGYLVFSNKKEGFALDSSISWEEAFAGPDSSPKFSFDLSQTSIPREEIYSGGPVKDGIPAITNPEITTVEDVDYLKPEDRVIGLRINGKSRAYPLKALTIYEVVNDRLAEQPVAVTYCPLCDSAVVFDSRHKGRDIEFGVSGSLYNSNVLIYDRDSETESLWSQMSSQAISGPAMNQTLKTLPLELTTWKDWSSRYPDTTVLKFSEEAAYHFGNNVYAEYFTTQDLMFEVEPHSNLMPNKTELLGVWSKFGARAYPLSAFDKDHLELDDEIAGKKITLRFDPESNSLRVVHADKGLQWVYSFWFAWYAFHPKTDVFE